MKSRRNRSYGCRPSRPDFRDYKFVQPIKQIVPPSLDMRLSQPPVFDQGQLGSCTANGICAEVEAQALMQGEKPSVYSRLFVYFNERSMEGTVPIDAGAEIRDGMKSVLAQGVCSESEWPYDISKFTAQPPMTCYNDAAKFEAKQYQSVFPSVAAIKSALLLSRGLVIGISVYESFESDEVAQTGIVPLPRATESQLGGHCVRLVGYTDVGLPGIPVQSFIGMNSWGTDWGLKGFFAIPYAYVTDPGLCSDLWVITAVS